MPQHNYSPMYVRDLKESLREETERQIRRDRPDLVEALDRGDDITIGGYWRSKDFELA